jgi:hypothetical protein
MAILVIVIVIVMSWMIIDMLILYRLSCRDDRLTGLLMLIAAWTLSIFDFSFIAKSSFWLDVPT